MGFPKLQYLEKLVLNFVIVKTTFFFDSQHSIHTGFRQEIRKLLMNLGSKRCSGYLKQYFTLVFNGNFRLLKSFQSLNLGQLKTLSQNPWMKTLLKNYCLFLFKLIFSMILYL